VIFVVSESETGGGTTYGRHIHQRPIETKGGVVSELSGTASPLWFYKDIVYYVANIPKCSPKDLSAFISRSRPTITNHLKKLVNLQILDEHATSANDPTKYYTIHLNK